MARKIPSSGINLFQLIYQLIREYEEKNGNRCLNLSLGNPDQIPPQEILDLKSKFQLKKDYELHTYAEDKNINSFSEGMVLSFTGLNIKDYPHLKALPSVGIKSITGILPLACGLHLNSRENFKVVTHLPAYDVIGTWTSHYLGSNRIVWPLRSQQQMKMNLADLKESLDQAKVDRPDLIFVIRPGNPASQGATRQEWEELISFCISKKIRLVNDGAYTTLTDPQSPTRHISLSEVAKDFPDLEWLELFSVSKAFHDPGQRLGVVFGSHDFIQDLILIKGNTDSGPQPAGMAAYGELFKDQAKTQSLLQEIYQTYQKRLKWLIPKLKAIGMQPACETSSGFFTLWKTPHEAFGINLVQKSVSEGISLAELFNRLTIQKTGIVGVHFTGKEDFIRYAVCTDVLSSSFQERFQEVLPLIQPRYH